MKFGPVSVWRGPRLPSTVIWARSGADERIAQTSVTIPVTHRETWSPPTLREAALVVVRERVALAEIGIAALATAGMSTGSTDGPPRSAGSSVRSITRWMRLSALEPIRQGVRHAFGAFGKNVARGLRLRCDWGRSTLPTRGSAR